MDELEKDVSKVGVAAMHRDGMPLKGKAVMDKASVTLVLRRESICLPGTNVGQHFSIRRTSRCDHPFVGRTSRHVLFLKSGSQLVLFVKEEQKCRLGTNGWMVWWTMESGLRLWRWH